MATTRTTNPGEEKVRIQLFKDGGKYKDDVYVSVSNRDGGENCLIQRGKPVEVKAKFAKVLEESMEQDARTAELITKGGEAYEKAKDALE